jgi:hypothetical protein
MTTTKNATKKAPVSNQDLLDKLVSVESVFAGTIEVFGETIQVMAQKIDDLTERLEEQKKKAGNPQNTFQVCRRFRLAALKEGFVSVKCEDDVWSLKGRMSDKLFALASEYAEDNGRLSKVSIESFLKQYGVKNE